jgi:hypothetical protein
MGKSLIRCDIGKWGSTLTQKMIDIVKKYNSNKYKKELVSLTFVFSQTSQLLENTVVFNVLIIIKHFPQRNNNIKPCF